MSPPLDLDNDLVDRIKSATLAVRDLDANKPALWIGNPSPDHASRKGSYKTPAAQWRKPDLQGPALIERIRKVGKIPLPGCAPLVEEPPPALVDQAVESPAVPILYAVVSRPGNRPTYYIRATSPEEAEACMTRNHPAGYSAELLPCPILRQAPNGFHVIDARDFLAPFVAADKVHAEEDAVRAARKAPRKARKRERADASTK